jgi:hypothetical protein
MTVACDNAYEIPINYIHQYLLLALLCCDQNFKPLPVLYSVVFTCAPAVATLLQCLLTMMVGLYLPRPRPDVIIPAITCTTDARHLSICTSHLPASTVSCTSTAIMPNALTAQPYQVIYPQCHMKHPDTRCRLTRSAARQYRIFKYDT